MESFSVYPIVNGCSTESVFSGSLDDCRSYASEYYPGSCIILSDYD